MPGLRGPVRGIGRLDDANPDTIGVSRRVTPAVDEHEPHLVGIGVPLAEDGHAEPLAVGHDIAARAVPGHRGSPVGRVAGTGPCGTPNPTSSTPWAPRVANWGASVPSAASRSRSARSSPGAPGPRTRT